MASPEVRAQIKTLLSQELAAAVGATVPLTGWAHRLTDEILALIEQDN